MWRMPETARFGRYNEVVSTLAGLAGNKGSSEGSGAARFSGPTLLALDNAGNIYLAEGDNHTIRKGTQIVVSPSHRPDQDQSVTFGALPAGRSGIRPLNSPRRQLGLP